MRGGGGEPGFGVVPHQFRAEVKVLGAAGIGDWWALAQVEDADADVPLPEVDKACKRVSNSHE